MPPKINDGLTKQQRYRLRHTGGRQVGHPVLYRDGLSRIQRLRAGRTKAKAPIEKKSQAVVAHKKQYRSCSARRPRCGLQTFACVGQTTVGWLRCLTPLSRSQALLLSRTVAPSSGIRGRCAYSPGTTTLISPYCRKMLSNWRMVTGNSMGWP